MVMQGNNGADQSGDHGEAESFDSQHLMGVRVVVDHDPAVAAARLAEELDGELIFDLENARRAFAARASAGRTDPVVLHDDEFDELLAQADELGSLGARPTVDEEALAELRQLAVALRRTDRIRVSTEVEFTEALNRRLSASSGMAVHPETIRQAALALTEAEAEVEQITHAIAELGDRPRPEQVRLDVPQAVPQMFDDDSLEEQRKARIVAISCLAFFAGAALVLLNFADSVVIPVVVFLLGVILSAALMARSYSIQPQDDPGAREASALLAAATGNAERTSEAGARDRVAEDEWMARRSQFEAARDRSLEKARSARRHWETLAGADADPYDLEGVLRLHDPQFVITGAATKTSPTVRTVNAVHRKAMARWKVAWASLGYENPPALDEFDEHLTRLGGAEARAEADKVDQRLKAAEAWATAGATIDRPLILVEPENWLPEDELESMLRTLPAGADVIVVTR
ncbi:MAG: hypothetical protein QOI95_2803 [Acidimicrobiaceae bacterium]|jgi:hypothetical protein